MKESMHSNLQSVFFAAVCLVGLSGVGLFSGCGGPDISDGAIACGLAEDCPPDFACGFDGRCYLESNFACDNGVIDPGESCDPKILCAESCNDGNACTKDALLGSADTCDVTCKYAVIETCVDGDGCCPANCGPEDDNDCSQTCGDNVVDPGETCDPQSSCLEECTDGVSCTTDVLTGSSDNCNVSCSFETISQCMDGDGCCPAGCGPSSDRDCSASCGDGEIDLGETCDPMESCPRSCDDDVACTLDTLIGNPENCTADCLYQPIVSCSNDDGCCPNGCTKANDNDCSSSCGDGVIDDEEGETCDPMTDCPTSCNDFNACTVDTKNGSASTCNVECSYSDIGQCDSGDGCCPQGCSSVNDSDCMGFDGGIPDAGIDAGMDAGMDSGVTPMDSGIGMIGDGGADPT